MKKYQMYLIMVVNALLRRKLRMFIALLAVAVGATIISGMVTVYREVPAQMGREFRLMAPICCFFRQTEKEPSVKTGCGGIQITGGI